MYVKTCSFFSHVIKVFLTLHLPSCKLAKVCILQIKSAQFREFFVNLILEVGKHFVVFLHSRKHASKAQSFYEFSSALWYYWYTYIDIPSMGKGCQNHRVTLCSSKGKIVYVVGKPCNIYRLQGKPCDNYRISLQSVNITGIPYNIHNLSL